jgi:hypothetical protein
LKNRPIRIAIGIPTMHERGGWVHPQLFQWATDLPYTVGDRYQFTISRLHNFIPAASARNFFCRQMKDLEPRPDWLLMIDNDMAPPMNLLDCVQNAPEDAMVVVPQFQMWDEGKPSVTLCWGMDDDIAPPLNDKTKVFTLEYGKFYPLTKCGTGAIFIRPGLFDRIEMPYFWYTINADQGMEHTEDINFAQKVIDAGCKIYGNSAVSVGHYHNVNLDILSKCFVPRPLPEVPVSNLGVDKDVTMETISPESPSVSASPAIG